MRRDLAFRKQTNASHRLPRQKIPTTALASPWARSAAFAGDPLPRAAPSPILWHYRQKINALVYQAIMEWRARNQRAFSTFN